MSGRGRMRVGQPGVLLRPHGRASMVVPPPGPPIIEQKLAAQHLEIQRLLTENQRFAATHVALRQDLTGVQHELLQLRQIISEKDAKILTLESDVEQARNETKSVNSHRQELLVQVQQMTQDLQRANAVRAENDSLRQELQRTRGSYDGSKEENGLFSLSKEVEKLRTATSYSGTSSTPYSTIQQPQQQQQQQPNGASRAETWTVHYAPNGALFYYNTVTGVTQWERPAALNGSPQVQMPQPAQLQQFQQIGQALLSPQQAYQLTSQVQPQSVSQSLLSAQASQGVQQYSSQPGGQMLYAPAAATSQVVGGGASGSSRGQSQQQQQQQAQILSTTQNPLSFLPRSSLDHGMASASKPPQVLEGASSTQSPSPASSSPSVNSRPQGAATLLVYGISADYRDMDLADMFKPYGSVLYAKVASAKEMAAGRPCGTVTMDSRRSAEAAISAMNGVSISGRALKVELKREDNESLYHSTSKKQQQGHGGPVKTYQQPAPYRPY